jgi:membrane protein YqaA with SNARE-associated domain
MGGLELLLSTLGMAIVSAFIPLVNAELLTIGAVALAPPALDVPCILMVTLGQMMGKVVLFLGGRGSLRIPWVVKAKKLEKAVERVGQRAAFGAPVVFVSAVTGLPPFYLASIACGVFRFSLPLFVVLGTAGRLIRFTLVGLFPHLVGQWVSD